MTEPHMTQVGKLKPGGVKCPRVRIIRTSLPIGHEVIVYRGPLYLVDRLRQTPTVVSSLVIFGADSTFGHKKRSYEATSDQ